MRKDWALALNKMIIPSKRNITTKHEKLKAKARVGCLFIISVLKDGVSEVGS